MGRVVIVGAGLAGLTAASCLRAAGQDVLVLEGGGEVGGRTRSRLVDGDVVELGAQFLSGQHRRMRRLVGEAGLHLRRPNYGLGPVRWRAPDNSVIRVLPATLRWSSLWAVGGLAVGSRSLHSIVSAAKDPTRWAELDACSVAEWLDNRGLPSSLRHLLDSCVDAAYGGADPRRISLLQFAALAGHDQAGLLHVLGDLSSIDLIVEGTGGVCAHLAGNLGSSVRTGAVVTAVEQDGNGVAVHIENQGVVSGDRAVIAVPTPALARIVFDPPLPKSIGAANDAVLYGQASKLAVVVGRRHILQPKVFIGGRSFIAGWRTRRVLYGFVRPEAATADASALVKELCTAFDVVDDNIERIEMVGWPQDRLYRGTYAHLPPGEFLNFRQSLPHRHGLLHFAGAERSTWPIFMEGAVESGENAARELTSRL